jgi:hypothetical protein
MGSHVTKHTTVPDKANCEYVRTCMYMHRVSTWNWFHGFWIRAVTCSLESKIANDFFFVYRCFVETRTYVNVHACFASLYVSTNQRGRRRHKTAERMEQLASRCVCTLEASDDGHCWGEGKGATPRSKSSLITAGQTETEQTGIPFAWSASDEDRRRSHPTVRPRPAQRPTCVPAHCNGPCVAAAGYRPIL